MEYIHPKVRFSKNLKSITLPPALLDDAIRASGLFADPYQSILLSGGFMNANFLVNDGSRKAVFRFSSNGERSWKIEQDLLRLLKKKALKVPEVLAGFECQGSAPTVMEFIDGITLEDRLLSGEPVELSLFREIGAQLALIHSVQFEKAGFFGPGAEPGGEFENSSAFQKEYIDKSLKGLESREDRLLPEITRRWRALLEAKWPLVLATEKTRSLVHCDFNPKNILVSRSAPAKLLAVLDWEFSWVGNGLMDFGNFFRFSYDYPPGAREAFVKAYREVSPALPADWEVASELIDLGNMCFFLERMEDYQESFRTARLIVNTSLEKFGY